VSALASTGSEANDEAAPRLAAAGIAALFLVGAVGGLIGDMCHVESGTTRNSAAIPSAASAA